MSDEKTTNLSSITGANLADNDLVMVVDVSDTTMAATGTNKKVTLNEFAQDSTFSSRYAPYAATSNIWVPANAFGLWSGSPTQTTAGPGAWPSWKLDASSDEGIATTMFLPAHWTTFHMDVYWTNDGAGSGDVRLQGFRYRFIEGSTINSVGTGTGVTDTADIEDDVVVTRIITSGNDLWSASGGPWWLGVYRDADNAADTLGNDIAVLGALLTRAS